MHILSLPEPERRKIMLAKLAKIVTEKRGSMDAASYKNSKIKITFTCENGHEWQAVPNRILNGGWCRKCWDKFYAGKYLKKDGLADARQIADKRKGKILSKEYINSHTPLRWECSNGHQWDLALSDAKRGSWCVQCNKYVKEKICKYYFEAITNHHFPKKKPTWLLNSAGNRLELDGYSEELKLGFEYQGEQHYRSINFFNTKGDTLEKRIKNDEDKRISCKNNNVILIEIPYHISIKDLQSYIRKEIIDKMPNLHLIDEDKIPIVNFIPNNQLKELKDIAKSKGGDCLSSSYNGIFEKHEFICKKGHQWKAMPNNIKNNDTWCPICKPERIGASNRKYNIKDMINLAKRRKGKFISTDFKSVNCKYKWECGEGHQWEATPSDIIKGGWCRKCFSSSMKGNLNDMKSLANKRGGNCLSLSYTKSTEPLLWECDKKHQWYAKPNNIKNKNSWCPFCAKNRLTK